VLAIPPKPHDRALITHLTDPEIQALLTGHTQAIPILDLPLATPPPDGAGWIEAYRRWHG